MLVGAVLHDGGTHRVDREHRHRSAGPHRLVVEDELLDLAAALAAVLGGPANAHPTVSGHLTDDLPMHLAHALLNVKRLTNLGGEDAVVVAPQFGAKRLLLCGVGQLHGSPPMG